MQNSFEDFKNAIGQRFKVAGFTGILGAQDIIITVHDNTQEVEGNKIIAHYTDCRFIQEQPEQLKTKKYTTTHQ